MKQFMLILLLFYPFSLFSQVNETFDGPELSPAWIGKDRDSFKINNDGRLQLAVTPTGKGNLSIGRNIAYSDNMQWEFDVCMQSEPSDDNRLLAFLYQESDHYYYVRLGYDGKKDLGFGQKGNNKMIPPQTEFETYPLLLHVKVTLENRETWTLYYKTKDMTGYRMEGQAIQAIVSPPEQGNLIFTIHYTKTKSDLFSIDNLFISDQITPTPLESDETEEEPETDPETLPELVDIELLTLNTLRFTFDQAVDKSGAVFSISDIGDAIRTSYADEEARTAVNALFEKEMEAGVDYTISYSGLKSANGSTMPDTSIPVTLEAGEEEEETPEEEPTPEPSVSYPAGTIRINEIMANPKDLEQLPETEYVELYNTLAEPVSLSGWQFVYGGSAKAISDVQVPAAGYAVLYRSGREIQVDETGVAVPMEKFPAQLSNDGKELQLWDPAGNVIDSVTYARATAARSWERSSSGWHLSTDSRGGTPGSANSSGEEPEEEEPEEDPAEPDTPQSTDPVQAGEIVINELLPDPYAGGSEYIELYNRSDKSLSVATLSLAVRKSDGTLNTRYSLASVSTPLEPDGYLLLTKDAESVSSFYEIENPDALYALDKLPILANTSSTLVLFRTDDGTVIDEVAYSSKWHASSIKSTKGVSLERIDPDAATQDPTNWTSAAETAGYGTPGYQNSQYGIPASGDATGIEPPVWMEETGEYTIAYWLDRPGYSCRAYVFNISGQRVAEIANHQLLGTSGEWIWDGSTREGRKLRTGVYIFYAEIYHADGIVKRFKKAFLVR